MRVPLTVGAKIIFAVQLAETARLDPQVFELIRKILWIRACQRDAADRQSRGPIVRQRDDFLSTFVSHCNQRPA